MRRKFLMCFITAACLSVIPACGSDGGAMETKAAIETETGTEAEVETPEMDEDSGIAAEPQVSANSAGMGEEGDGAAYTMSYDTELFTLDSSGDADIYTYSGPEELAAPVYISVQAYPDMDAQELADGIALQSGIDGVTPKDTYFGADGILTKCVDIDMEGNGVTQFVTSFVISVKDGSLLVEVGGYDSMPKQVGYQLEEALGTFTLSN